MPESQNVHVYPKKDLAPHNTDGLICPCNPIVEDTEWGDKFVVHHAYDHREILERYNSKAEG